MSLLPFFDWCQSTPLAAALRDSIWAAPVIDVTHLIALAMLFGPVLILNLRLSGLVLRDQPVAEIAEAVMPWWRRGLLLSTVSGLLFFAGSAIKAYNVAPFYAKMALLGMALTFQSTVIRKIASTPGVDRARVASAISMILWIGVPAGGFWIELF
jgi:hypothetical protein